MNWMIQFYYDKSLDPLFINKLFYFLVSRGVRYNSKYRASYYIFTTEPVNDIEYTEKIVKESTEHLADILDKLFKYDLKSTSFTIYLDYCGDTPFQFEISLRQAKDDLSIISFESNDEAIPDDRTFMSYICLCKETFVRFSFPYGIFRNRDEDIINYEDSSSYNLKTNVVNFYSMPLVEKIGEDKLLQAPGYLVESLGEAGIMLLICPYPKGCLEKIQKVNFHLSLAQ